MSLRKDRPTIGATTSSTPLPSSESQVYQPQFPNVAAEIQTRQMISNLDNRAIVSEAEMICVKDFVTPFVLAAVPACMVTDSVMVLTTPVTWVTSRVS